jgi:Putative phage tail protein
MILSEIVTILSARCGVSAAEIDVTELTDNVTGFVVAGLYPASEVIRSLQKTYFFDPVEVDGVIKFVKRGGAAVASIDESEMLDSPEETTREQEYEFPKKLHLSYQNAAIDYAPTQANAERSSPDIRVTSEMAVEVPVVLSSDQAIVIAHKMIKTAWIDAMGEVKFQLPDNYSRITPTDPLTLTYRGRSVRVRVDKVEMSEGYMNITSRFDRISAYTADLTGAPIQPVLPPSETSPGDTYFEVMNIPALIDADDRMGYYVIAAGELGGWSGAVIHRSIDAGANYIDVDTFGTGAIMGEVAIALPNASEYATDTTNTLTVTLYGPPANELESINETQFLQEYNAALVGDEIIQFKNAVEVVEGTWELTTLNRGRQGTTPAAHSIGERFCLLEGAHFVECSSALVGASLTHRAVAYTTDPTLATPTTATFSPARSQQEFAPVNLTLSKNGNILTASWTPRHRFGTAITPVASVNFEGFDIQIVGSSTISLTTTGSSIVQDITGLGTVTVTVAGINRITGVSTLTASGVI